jgi:hypothetical protein
VFAAFQPPFQKVTPRDLTIRGWKNESDSGGFLDLMDGINAFLEEQKRPEICRADVQIAARLSTVDREFGVSGRMDNQIQSPIPMSRTGISVNSLKSVSSCLDLDPD